MDSKVVCLDIHALAITDQPPVYRLYVDGFLMTERTYIADNLEGTYYSERSPIIVTQDPICVEIQWIQPALNYEIKNIGIKDTKCSAIVVNQDKHNFLAKVTYEDQ
jgi:hypothetical protein